MSKLTIHFLKVLGVAAGLIVLALLLMPSTVYAQSTGTVTGTVYDQSGAVVPAAKISLVNHTTHDVRQSVSNDVGYFAFPSVFPGTYDLTVVANNFRTWQQTGLVVRPGDLRNVSDISLTLGKVEQTVTVQALAAEVAPTDSGERSASLTGTDIQNLALTGRDVTELVKILPGFNNFTDQGGVQNTSGYTATVVSIGSAIGNGYSANGSPNRGGTALISDGANVIDPGCNCSATQTINDDMVQEVKVQASNFGADSAKGPVVVNAVGKSGSATYRGEAYLYARDAILNSTDWYVGNQRQNKPSDRYLYPGAQFGGPIPHTQKKLLFFSSYEYYHQAFPGPLLSTIVPTLSMRQGNFSLLQADNQALCGTSFAAHDQWSYPNGSFCTQPTDPNNNDQPFLNDQLTGMDPAGLAILKMIPKPNTTPSAIYGANYVNQVLQNQNGGMVHTRLDYNFSENTKLYGTYNFQGEQGASPVMIWWTPTNSVTYPGDVTQNNRSHTVALNLVHVFSPTATNEAIATFSYGYFPFTVGNPKAVSRKALGYPYQDMLKTGVDQMPAISDYGNAGYPQMLMYGFTNNLLYSRKVLPTFTDNFTKVVQNHTLKVGFYSELTGNKQLNPGSYTQEQMSFIPGWGWWGNPNNNWSGQSLQNGNANLLMGYYNQVTQVNFDPVDNMAYKTLAFYAHDDWKFNRRLTLNLGIRFDHLGAWYDRHNIGMAIWDPSLFSSQLAAGKTLPGLQWHAIDKTVPVSGRTVDALFYSPRVGMAWDIFGTGKTVLRGGIGAYRYAEQYNDYAGPLATALGQKTYNAYSGTLATLASVQAGGPAGPYSEYALNPHDHAQPITWSYNFTISQRTPANYLLEIAYVGNQTSSMDNTQGSNSGLQNINYIRPGSYFLPNPVNGTNYYTAFGATYGVDTNATSNYINSNLKDTYRPYSACTIANTSKGDASGSCSGYSNLNVLSHNAWANYNALQVSWTKQKGWAIAGLNYTWSKALGINSAANPANLHADYGVLAMDRTHVFNANYTFDLGSHYRGHSALLRGAANGWSISGITSLQSGVNLQVASQSGFNLSMNGASTNNITTQNFTVLGTPDVTLMPVLTCNPASALNRDHQFMNAACFTAPDAVGQNGTFQMPYMHGPAFLESDLSTYKNFKITERQALQFRFSAFNFLNHPLVSFSDSNTNNMRLTFTQTQRTPVVSNSNDFGVANIKYGRRVVEMAIKYTF
jgi:hypothetical protein